MEKSSCVSLFAMPKTKMKGENTMIKIVEDFKTYLIEDGKSPKTIQSYVGDVAGLLKYLETMGTEFEGNLKRFYVTTYIPLN